MLYQNRQVVFVEPEPFSVMKRATRRELRPRTKIGRSESPENSPKTSGSSSVTSLPTDVRVPSRFRQREFLTACHSQQSAMTGLMRQMLEIVTRLDPPAGGTAGITSTEGARRT
jgi:hypothetical protein